MSDPPNDTNDDERQLLVNAYVDGEASHDERARVEADPDLLAAAEELRAVKSAVAEVPTLSDAARQRFLGAAATAFDERPAATAPPPPARPMRPRSNRLLALAAAAVVVVAGGAVAAVVTQSDDDGADNAGAPPAQEDDAEGETELGAVQDGVGQSDSDGAAPAPEIDDESAAPPSSGGAGGYTNQDLERRDVSTDRQLAGWYEQVQNGDLRPERGGDEVCGSEILGEASFQGRPVVVAERGDRIVVLDQASCERVAAIDTP